MDGIVLAIHDVSPAIGLPHLQLDHPASTYAIPGLPAAQNALDILAAQLDSQLHLIIALQARIAELERRTWWSMLKAQVRSWYERLRPHSG